MKPANVRGIMVVIIVSCIIGAAWNYIELASSGNLATKDIIIRCFIIFVLSAFVIISFDFFDKVVAFTNESNFESWFTIFIVGLYGILLKLAANHTWYSLLTIGFIALFFRALLLYRSAKKRTPAYPTIVIKFFRKYVVAYLFAVGITLFFISVDLRFISLEKMYDKTFNPPPAREITAIHLQIDSIKQLLDTSQSKSNAAIITNHLATIEKNVEAVATKLHSKETSFGITLFFGLLALFFYFCFIVISSIFGKRIKKLDVIEVIKKHQLGSETKNEVTFSTLKSLVKIARPFVALIAALISSVIHYSYTTKFSISGLLFVVVFLTTCFGFIINDYFDIEKDKVNHPRRVLPLGLISPRTALYLGIFVSLTSIIISVFISTFVLLINFLTILLLAVYSKINNRYGIWANFITAFCSALVLLISKTDITFDLVCASSISAFVLILGREIIFDVQDIEGDKSVRKTSMPIVFNIKRSLLFAGFLFFFNAALTLFFAYYFKSSSYFLFIGLISNFLVIGSYLFYIIKQTDKSEILFTNLTRVSLLLIIPALIFGF